FESHNVIGTDLGETWVPETITIVPVTHTFGQPLTIAPISVNHIEIADPAGVKFAVNGGGGDGWIGYPFLNGGGSQMVYSTTSTINTSGLVDPAPQHVYQHLQAEHSTMTWTAKNLNPAATYKVRIHLSGIPFTSESVAGNFSVSGANGPFTINNVIPYGC